VLPPSTWWDEVAVPQRNPRGKWMVASLIYGSFDLEIVLLYYR